MVCLRSSLPVSRYWLDGSSEVVATSVEVLARLSEVATIDGLPEFVATSVEVLARWSEIVITASCVLVIPGWSVVAEIGASGCAVGSVTVELSGGEEESPAPRWAPIVVSIYGR
ncbi:hypothetical protein F2Q68_00030234 [Brassica cretica]|uniref:Uncharacterized protein n=1 Tax=Brassica cretica TaxID=69181 RepID=A0A8S9GI76_BRACR|nr:hypothetical protein F2Q68_00030234 [Brassica cretica]